MDFIGMNASLRPNKRAIIDLTNEKQWTYKEFDMFIAKIATYLMENDDIETGSRVACLSKNRAEIIALHLACARIGTIFVPLNWRLAVNEIAQLTDDCTPSLFFYDDFVNEKKLIPENILNKSLNFSTLIEDVSELKPCAITHVDLNKPSLILYTSGTTGLPKGVVLTEANIFETAFNLSILAEINEQSGFLSEGPMYHIIGIITSIRPVLWKGGHVCLSDSFVPERTLSYMTDKDLGVTHYFCVPQMAHALREVPTFNADKLRKLKAIFTGGAPHPAAQIMDWINDDLLIIDGYGSSEAGTVFGMPLEHSIIKEKAGAVGISTPRIESKIINSSGENVVNGDAGELLIKGANISAGYWKKCGGYTPTLSEDGWFSTGDIVSQDNDGYFRILDRKKDMYISGGENVYPAEVEAHTVKFPGIIEQSIVGVANEKWGEVGCLFYVSDQKIIFEELLGYLDGKVARYKLPHIIQRIDIIPRNSAGKVLKNELRKMVVG